MNIKNHSFPVEWITETDSTNSAILELIKTTDQKKLVLVADHQTAGRGQFGRKWLSQPKENLLFSIYFQPTISPADAPQITQIACRAVLSSLTDCGISCTIKHPNDILANGKKICGILTESSSSGKKLNYVVVGIGLNVNSSNESLLPEATSMKIESNRSFDRQTLLNQLVFSFENHMCAHFSLKFDQLVGNKS